MGMERKQDFAAADSFILITFLVILKIRYAVFHIDFNTTVCAFLKRRDATKNTQK